MNAFSPADFAFRWVLALVLVMGTFNPTDYSYWGWITQPDGAALPYKLLAGVVIAIAFVIYGRATWRSIGPIGLGLAAAFFGAIVWVLIDLGLLNLNEPTAITWVLLVVFATIMAIGISWSHIRRRITGQVDVDDVED